MFLHLSSELELDKSIASTTLPTARTFNGPHEVAVIDASITNSWINSPTTNNYITFSSSIPSVQSAKFPAQYYEDSDSIGNVLVALIKGVEMEAFFKITGFRTNERVLKIEILHGCSIEMHPELRAFLGIDQNATLSNDGDRKKMTVKLEPKPNENFNRIFLTSDLVGSTPLLASIPVKRSHSDLSTYQMITPTYLPLNCNRLEKAVVNFVDEKGRALKLLFGSSYALVHIRPVI